MHPEPQHIGFFSRGSPESTMSEDSSVTTAEGPGPADGISWTLLDLEELVTTYWSSIAPVMREDGLDPEMDRPTHAWLSANGFRGLIYALREYHDRTFSEFWSEDLDLEQQEESYDWGTSDEPTVDLLKAYVESQRERGELSESSADTLRYRIAKYVRAYREVNDSGDLLGPIARDGDVPAYEATDAAWAAFDHLDEELAPRTMRRIHEAVDDWYAHLIRRKRAAVNPVAGLDDEYRWSRRMDGTEETHANTALDSTHVRALYKGTTSLSERVLVVALCGWGLRSGEVAALHRSQLVFDPPEADVPYVDFEERKNGPGQVSILCGRDAATDRLAELGEEESWSGYLFPSSRSASGHLTRQTILRRFDNLADRAGLPDAIAGEKPVPQMARRFWYDAYSATQEAILEEVGEIAAEQGSASAEVVLQEYLSPERRRRLRREYMRERLGEAFGEATT
jgi:site-specific recombinase XerD